MPNHDTGVWLDEGGNVVYEQPEGRSTQLVAKGGSVSSAARSRLEALGVTVDDSDDKPDEITPADSDDDPGPVVTSEPAKRAAKKSSK